MKKYLTLLTKELRRHDRLFTSRHMRPPWRIAKKLTKTITFAVPCYNVANYIDEFMQSLITQSCGRENLEIILVNDGSTDNTGELVDQWRSRYPKTVKTIHQLNGGLCAARNAGLAAATGEWITFADPDDVLQINYLHHVMRAIEKGAQWNVSMVSCNFKILDDKTGKIEDRHGLRYRYKSAETWLRAEDPEDFIQLAVNSAFFKTDLIKTWRLSFDKRIKPGFEDAHFTNRYLLRAKKTSIAFLRSAVYFYRKRADQSSLQDKAKSSKEFYIDQIKFGWLPLLEEAKQTNGRVPRFIQVTVLYDTIGHLLNYVRTQRTVAPLTKDELNEYNKLVHEAFTYIDVNTIETASLPSFHEEMRVGMLNLFKGMARAFTTVYLKKYDRKTQAAKYIYFSGNPACTVRCRTSDGKDLDKYNPKTIVHRFVGDPMYYEHSFWVSIGAAAKVEFSDGEVLAKLKGGRGPITNPATANDIERALIPAFKEKITPGQASQRRDVFDKEHSRFDGCWLLMDRPDKGDDNAEHFYRYLKNHRPQQNAYFLLEKSSPDWKRLEKDGFNLIEFLSKQHLAALARADYFLSSHGDRYIRRPFPDTHLSDLFSYRFIFLQHGVTLHDQSEWFNTMDIELIASATNEEYQSLTDKNSLYNLTEKEVSLTGFPRHDALLAAPASRETIFIMPTWRQHLSTRPAKSGVHELKAGFHNTNYATTWRNLLNSRELKDLAESKGLTIVFCPHPNLASHLKDLDVPNYVEVRHPLRVRSLQNEFRKCALMITDYSSVAFESAYLNKPLIYFQFDREVFYHTHIYRPGYFSYTDHGFGPVVTTESGVIDAATKALSGLEDPMYEERRKSTFPFRDGKCSERLYQAVSTLSC